MMMRPLPRIMVAPNGARLQKSDHKAVPVTIEEIGITAKACELAGADGIHAHIRDEHGKHLLDVGAYRELLVELRHAVPDMYHQITTEAVGRYSASEQMEIIRDLQPNAASLGLREIEIGNKDRQVTDFYSECRELDIDIQHILYAPEELDRLAELFASAQLELAGTKVLFVLGRYTRNQQSSLEQLNPFTDRLAGLPGLDWAVCAFGINETVILRHALLLGGKARIGFENNIFNEDGLIATSNEQRVAQLIANG